MGGQGAQLGVSKSMHRFSQKISIQSSLELQIHATSGDKARRQILALRLGGDGSQGSARWPKAQTRKPKTKHQLLLGIVPDLSIVVSSGLSNVKPVAPTELL